MNVRQSTFHLGCIIPLVVAWWTVKNNILNLDGLVLNNFWFCESLKQIHTS